VLAPPDRLYAVDLAARYAIEELERDPPDRDAAQALLAGAVHMLKLKPYSE
jgi:hypothetical protein